VNLKMFDLNLVFHYFFKQDRPTVNPSYLDVFGVTWRGEHFDDSKPGVHKACPKPLEKRPTCPGK